MAVFVFCIYKFFAKEEKMEGKVFAFIFCLFLFLTSIVFARTSVKVILTIMGQ
jgi:hypothetical protein